MVLRLARITRIQHHPAVYYGWVMLVAVALAQVTSWGVLYYSFAVFIAPIQDETGWSIAQVTGAYSLALMLSGVAAIPIGRWLDRHGPRGVMTAGSCLATLLVIAWSQVENLTHLYLVWAGIGLILAAVLYEPAFYVVANWFERLRSRALTILTFIGGFASVIYIPLANYLIDAYGWRTALLILAGTLAIGTIPIHILLLRRSPMDMGLMPDGRPAQFEDTGRVRDVRRSITPHAALRDPAFWWLSAAFFLATVATMAMTVHLIPYLMMQGYSTGFAASAAGMIGLLALPGRLIFTPLGSKIRRQYVTAIIFALQTVSLVVLLSIHNTVGVLLFVVLFGAGFGAITPARAAMIAESYGPAHYGSINGMLALAVTGARGLAPVTAGLIYALFDSYSPVLWLLVTVSAVASLAALRSRSSLLENKTERRV